MVYTRRRAMSLARSAGERSRRASSNACASVFAPPEMLTQSGRSSGLSAATSKWREPAVDLPSPTAAIP